MWAEQATLEHAKRLVHQHLMLLVDDAVLCHQSDFDYGTWRELVALFEALEDSSA
ncbi:MAG: hypothetical protein V3U32_08330 [Anaerolineales bacterium]